MLIRIDASAAEAVFDQIASAIRAAIAAGEVLPGERLPAARDLAESLGINVHTVLHAYQALRDEGLLELRRGRGAVIRGTPASDELRRAIAATVEEAKAAGVGLPTLTALIRKEYAR